jgi:hypothetical protein
LGHVAIYGIGFINPAFGLAIAIGTMMHHVIDNYKQLGNYDDKLHLEPRILTNQNDKFSPMTNLYTVKIMNVFAENFLNGAIDEISSFTALSPTITALALVAFSAYAGMATFGIAPWPSITNMTSLI